MGYHIHPHCSSQFSSPPLALQQLVFAVLYSSFAIYLATAATSNDTHPTVPLSCPSDNRTRIRVDDEGHTIMGEVMEDTLLTNVITAFNENRNVTDFYIQTGGIYLFSETVPYNSKIARIRAFGYVTDEILKLIFQTEPSNNITEVPILFPLVLRQDLESESYQLIHGSMSDLLFHTLSPGSLPEDEDQVLDWAVKKGDRIGALIPPGDCVTDPNKPSLLHCPSYINLRATPQECLSALYYEVGDMEDLEDVNFPANQFEEVHVRLNLEATLVPQDSSKLKTIITSVVVVGALSVVIVLVICCILRRKQRSQSGNCQEIGMSKANEIGSGDIKPIAAVNKAVEQEINDRPPVATPETLVNDGYSLVARETPINDNDDGYMGDGDSGYDYDYQEPYFEPANEEEELIVQLNTKLAVTTIPRQDLELCEVLGSGAFGTVYRGVWSHKKEEVAVKTISEEVSEKDKIRFLQEAAIMAQFKHTNIVRIRGVLREEAMIMIVLDLMGGGDLRQYLLTSVRNSLTSLEPLELCSMLLSYTRQVALGMMYLMNKSYVHRDLAARNVLVSRDGLICKIGDFGLSRDLQKENFYISHGGKIPVKWTAPEALQYRRYSTASDAWSYGCVLYEIWSLGEKPFKDVSNSEAMKHVVAGYRLPPPPGCPKSIYEIMIKCWNPNVDERLQFCAITQQLQQSDFHLMKWSAEDTKKYSQETRTLGAALKLGQLLFRELQNTYIMVQH